MTVHSAESRTGRTGDTTHKVNRYTYRAEWSSEFGEYLSRCLEMPWLSHRAPTLQAAIAGMEQAVDEYVAECDGTAPRPLTDRKFSGRFLVRTSPMLHSRLTVEAAENHVSLNQWERAEAPEKLDRPPVSYF